SEGPGELSVTNLSPWVTTVGAGTLDRDFPANIILGNGEIVRGVSLYSGKALGSDLVPLILCWRHLCWNYHTFKLQLKCLHREFDVVLKYDEVKRFIYHY
ncbi:hypothetical protein KI387_022945, partial [Taxus chinensis]